MVEEFNYETVQIKGMFHFSNMESNFKGPITKGYRPIIWYGKSNKMSTSCSFISEVIINMGECKQVEIVILNEKQLGTKIQKGSLLNIGSTITKIGELEVLEHLGRWKGGNVP